LPGFVDTGWFAFKESTMSRTLRTWVPPPVGGTGAGRPEAWEPGSLGRPQL